VAMAAARVPRTDDGEGYKEGRDALSQSRTRRSAAAFTRAVVCGRPAGFIEHGKAKGPEVGRDVGVGLA